MNLLTIPRASRPENARVRRVGIGSVRISRWAWAVSASGVSISAVPIWAAAAPAHSTAATAAPVAIPPLAISGSSEVAADEL